MSIAGIVAADQSIILRLNTLAGRYPHFDRAIELLSQNDLKDAIFVAMFWWFWFRRGDSLTVRQTREHLLCLLCAGTGAIVVARICALTLPFRVRPRFEPSLHFAVPAGAVSDLVDWSAFPSDHAALFAAFAVGIYFISRPAGLLAMLYSLLIICLPRIYLGLHYPSDILIGLLLGVAVAYAMDAEHIRHPLAGRLLKWERSSPRGFYTGLFMVSYEYSTMFSGLRAAASAAAHAAHVF